MFWQLEAIYKRPNTSKKHSEKRIYRYLSEKCITQGNQVWCADISHTPLRRCFLHLIAIMDGARRRVLLWRFSDTMDANFGKEALDEAITKYGPPKIMTADQGA